MRYKVLGNTGLFVSELCLGTLTFGVNEGPFAAATGVQQPEADSIVKKAFEAGITFFDTANAYAAGQAEQIFGTALQHTGISRQEVVIATKFGSPMGMGPNQMGATRTHILEQVKGSLKRLATDYIDLYQLHAWDPATPIDESLRALEDLVQQGLVRYVGVCNLSAWQLVKTLWSSEVAKGPSLKSYQGYYSIVGREVEREILPVLESEKLGFMVYSPLASGYLTGKYRDNAQAGRRATITFPKVDETIGAKVLAALDEIAHQQNTSIAAVALAWLLQKKAVTSVIVGVKNLPQLEENLKCTAVVLTEQEVAALDQASALPTEGASTVSEYTEMLRKELMRTGKLPQPPQA